MNRDVCDRCGKVTRPGDVHTCTAKALRLAERLAYVCKYSDSEHWDDLAAAAAELRRLHSMTERRLTDEVIADLWAKNGTFHHHFAHAVERWLRGD